MRNKDIPLTHTQRQVLLGSLLGDACIVKRKQNHNARVEWGHSIKQRDYVEWKYNILKDVIPSAPKSYTPFSIEIYTRMIPCITEIYDLMGSREITQRWLDEITDPIALAVWYMDDGNCSKNKGNGYVITFSTGNRELYELELLKSWMNDRFELDCVGIYIPKKKPIATKLKIWSDRTIRKFEELVRPHIIPSMQYKLPPVGRPQCKYQTPKYGVL